MVGNYNEGWNSCAQNPKFCASLKEHAFNDNAETLCNLLVQYVGTSGTGRNTVSHYTRSKNGFNFYLELKGNLKTKSYEEKKLQRPMMFYKVHIMTETGISHSRIIIDIS